MNGNAAATHGKDAIDQELGRVSAALDACLDPRTPNDTRRQALDLLEEVKSRPAAPLYGITLAQDHDRPQAVRYFGLQLLEYALRYRFDQLDDAQVTQAIRWVIGLSKICIDNDAPYFRNKVAQLWVQCAERAWPEPWQDMDNALFDLWSHSEAVFTSKIMVLDILESLSSDMTAEDTLAALRLEDLGSAVNDIVLPKADRGLALRDRDISEAEVQTSDSEGWLSRIRSFLVVCLHKTQSGSNLVKRSDCVTRALAALKSFATWADIAAFVGPDMLDPICSGLESGDWNVKLGCIELLNAIAIRVLDTDADRSGIFTHIINPRVMNVLASIFTADRSIDEEAYRVQLKASGLLETLIRAVVCTPDAASQSSGFDAMFNLLPSVLQSDSLTMSIPVLHGWTKLLSSSHKRLKEKASDVLGVLIETCAQRLVDFEILGEDFDHPIVTLLYQDFDTMPERHAFLANYRRYCTQLIEQITGQRPVDTLEYVVSRTRDLLHTGPYTRSKGLTVTAYSKTSLAVLQMEAQTKIVLTVTNYLTKLAVLDSETLVDMYGEQARSAIDSRLRELCSNMISISLDDPEAQSAIITILSAVLRSHRTLSDLTLNITKCVLQARMLVNEGNLTFKECVKNFEAIRIVELQKIGLVYADNLAEVYEDLEQAISALSDEHSDNQKVVSGCHAFMFIINHRASNLAYEIRMHRLQEILQPMSSAWTSPVILHAVSTFETFCECLGVGNLAAFYDAQGFAKVDDWASQQLNAEGLSQLNLIKDRLDNLPIRITRALLGATTEKLKEGSDTHEMACRLWEPLIPLVLPALLKMIGFAQAFTNMSHWSTLPQHVQGVIQRSLQDRFWQSGISNESRDQFYARVSGSKDSFEGFASCVRGSIRSVREQSYQVLFLFTKFEEQFYGLHDLPQPLADALFDDCTSLSANHLNPLISLMTGLTHSCPPHHRTHFLPPLLRRMFTKLDEKISREWAVAIHGNEQRADEDELSEEMRIESVLRQVTFSAVTFVALLLDPERTSTRQKLKPTLSSVVLSDNTVLEPLILFCTHALRIRDTRCCTVVCRVLASILPSFLTDTESASQVREFICTEVVKAVIISLNEQYFVDMQRDLAALLAQILELYAPRTNTPREILLSLPDMQPSKVDSAIAKLLKRPSARQQRALILNLLESVRGVSIHDMGKVSRGTKKESGIGVSAQYMEVEQKPSINDGNEVGLDGVAGLFGD